LAVSLINWMLRGARVERDGVVFIRSNPIRRMVTRGASKTNPLLEKRHADAADRLLTAWEEAGFVLMRAPPAPTTAYSTSS
jgi:hypothetical protein